MRLPFEEIPDPAVAVADASYSYIDSGLEPGMVCRYRIYLDVDGHERMLIETDPVQVPSVSLTMFQKLLNPSTTIRHYIPEKSQVRSAIYSVTGRLIGRIVNELEDRDFHTVEWDGADREGRPVAAGIYVCILKSHKNTAARKMVLVR